jgi:hypothetical protein
MSLTPCCSIRSDVKRQRTISVERSQSPSNGESLGATSDQDPTKKKQAPRGAAARSQREKELREKERERAEAANKRKGRAERRRAEGTSRFRELVRCATLTSNTEEEAAEAERAKAAIETAAEEGSASQPPDTPSGSAVGAPTREGPRRGPRPGGKRGRGGRGGFFHRETYTGEGSPAGGKNGKEKSVSPKDPTDGPGSGADSSATTNAPAPPTRRGRPSQNNSNGVPREPTMAELKRRAAAMLDFIAQSQIDTERTETKDLGVNGNATPSAPVAKSIAPEETSPTAGLAGDLATRLAKWQQEFTGEGVSIESGGK